MQGKRGFTMIELLVCTYIISVLTILMLPLYKKPDFSSEYFVLEALSLQSEAMKENEERSILVENVELRYNSLGNINQARTLVFDKSEIIVQLGWGRLVEK